MRLGALFPTQKWVIVGKCIWRITNMSLRKTFDNSTFLMHIWLTLLVHLMYERRGSSLEYKIFCIYSVVQKNCPPVWNCRLISAKQNGQPMHSQLALTEHASLNLAPLILLDPVKVRWDCLLWGIRREKIHQMLTNWWKWEKFQALQLLLVSVWVLSIYFMSSNWILPSGGKLSAECKSEWGPWWV